MCVMRCGALTAKTKLAGASSAQPLTSLGVGMR